MRLLVDGAARRAAARAEDAQGPAPDETQAEEREVMFKVVRIGEDDQPQIVANLRRITPAAPGSVASSEEMETRTEAEFETLTEAIAAAIQFRHGVGVKAVYVTGQDGDGELVWPVASEDAMDVAHQIVPDTENVAPLSPNTSPADTRTEEPSL